MSDPTLLEIIPNQLFQNRFISDIVKVKRKLDHVIENQRKELSAMVGERYSDIIHAADTIEEMKLTITITLEHIRIMSATNRNLHNTHLGRIKFHDNSSLNFNSLYAISIEIKLLLECQEKIWSLMETEDYIKASKLFLLSRHINSELQLQIRGKELTSLQSLIQRLWYSMSNVRQTIIDNCSKKMQDSNLTLEMALSCLTSLYILANQNVVELLNILIDKFCYSNIKSTLENDINFQTKDKIVNGLKIVLKTILLIYSCFFNREGSMLFTKLRALYMKDSEPLIKLVYFMDSAAINILPNTILNYRLTTNLEFDTLLQNNLSDSVENWTVWLKAFIPVKVEKLFQNITQITALHEIRKEALSNVDVPENWGLICTAINLPEINVWHDYFQPSLTRRVKTIIDNHWRNFDDVFKMQILEDLSRLSCECITEKESDINWFVWKDLVGDTTIETNSKVIEVMNNLLTCMSLQDHGVTPNLQNLGKKVDMELQTLVEDLKIYLTHNSNSISEDRILLCDSEGNIDQILIDKECIEQYLQDVADYHIQYMIDYIKGLFKESTIQLSEMQQITTAVYMARFLGGAATLIPHLRTCYFPITDPKNKVRWDAINDKLKKNCIFCWKKWLDIVIRKVTVLTKVLPHEFTLEANIDYLMMQWDTIKIQEKNDDGTTIESFIKVPAGPSLKLQEYLYQVSTILHAIIPHTLPAEIHLDFIEKFTNITLTHYDNVISRNDTAINQRCALQLLMDVRLLNMLVPRENQKILDYSRSICEVLRQKIDPFDYNVFNPYIQNNLKRSVQRVQILLGDLILHHGQLNSILGRQPVVSSSVAVDKPTTILASTDFCWFSLLPVARVQKMKQINLVESDIPLENPSTNKLDTPGSMTRIHFGNARSGAAAFFNSVAMEWFSSAK